MLDRLLTYSDGQSIVLNATSGFSTNIVDLGALTDDRGTAKNQFGPSNGDLRLVVSVAVQPTAGTALYLELYDCATEGGTYKPTGIGIDSANAFAIADMDPGVVLLNVPIPASLMRYTKIQYTTTGNHTGSAGTINARLEYGTRSENVTPYRV